MFKGMLSKLASVLSHVGGCARVTLIVPKLIEELRFYFLEYGKDFPIRGIEAVNRFCRHTIGLKMAEMRQLVLPASSTLLTALLPQLDAAARTTKAAQDKDPSSSSHGQISWVLGKRPSDHSQEWIRIGFDPEGDKPGLPMYFPQRGIGSDWQFILQIGEKREGIIYPYDWADFCVPQLACRAVGLMNNKSLTLDEATDAIAWKLSKYRSMGFY